MKESEQIKQRISEAERERERLQTKNMILIREIATVERSKTAKSQEIRRKAESEIARSEQQLDREIDKLKKEQHRSENLINANNINIMNLQRQLENADRNST